MREGEGRETRARETKRDNSAPCSARAAGCGARRAWLTPDSYTGLGVQPDGGGHGALIYKPTLPFHPPPAPVSRRRPARPRLPPPASRPGRHLSPNQTAPPWPPASGPTLSPCCATARWQARSWVGRGARAPWPRPRPQLVEPSLACLSPPPSRCRPRRRRRPPWKTRPRPGRRPRQPRPRSRGRHRRRRRRGCTPAAAPRPWQVAAVAVRPRLQRRRPPPRTTRRQEVACARWWPVGAVAAAG